MGDYEAGDVGGTEGDEGREGAGDDFVLQLVGGMELLDAQHGIQQLGVSLLILG